MSGDYKIIISESGDSLIIVEFSINENLEISFGEPYVNFN